MGRGEHARCESALGLSLLLLFDGSGHDVMGN